MLKLIRSLILSSFLGCTIFILFSPAPAINQHKLIQITIVVFVVVILIRVVSKLAPRLTLHRNDDKLDE